MFGKYQLLTIMNNCLVISDLNYLQDIEDNALIGGYVSANGYTYTEAGSSFTNAMAGASAVGELTFTSTLAITEVKKIGWGNFSSATASSQAYAYSSNQFASFSSYSSSTLFELNYG